MAEATTVLPSVEDDREAKPIWYDGAETGMHSLQEAADCVRGERLLRKAADVDVWKTTIEMTPVAKQRPRLTRTGKAYTPRETRDAENLIKNHIFTTRPPRFEGPVAIVTRYVLSRPSSAPKKRKWPQVRPDLDNFLKLTLDALNGILFHDDGQVVSLAAQKEYGDPPRVEITVKAVNE